MALIPGAINFGSNFNIGAKGPIDARQRVETIADLTTVWTANIPAYKGMVVSVLEDNSIYILKTDDATVLDNWKKIGDVSGDITSLQTQITANKTAIDTINGTGDGSITKAVSDAKTELIGNDATVDTIKHAEKLATDASAKVDTEIGKLNSTVHNEATSAGDVASAQIKVTVEESKGKLTGVTVNAPSFESAGAADAVKTELLGDAATDYNTLGKLEDKIQAEALRADTAEKVNAAAAAAAQKTIDDFKNRAEGFATEAQGAKADSAIQSVAAKTGDKYITATPNGTSIEIASKGIDSAIKTAADAVKVSVNGGGYITGSTDATGRVITLGSTTQTISDASTTAKGLAEASDVKSYVDGKVSEINTAAGELGTRVTTLEGKHAKGKTVAEEVTTGIAGIAETSKSNTAGSDVVVTVTTKSGSVSSVAVDSSVLKKAVTDETTRAMAAEKKNADAAAAAKTAADNAQQTADSKIKSVTGNTTVVATTTEHAVSVSLKTSDKGNVKFTQDTDGLSANVTIPEATVTGVKADDKFLSLADKLVSADVSIAYDAADKKIYLYGKDKNKANAVSSIDCRDFIKDGMLDSASLVTNPDGQSAGTYIKLTWNTDGGKDPMYINVTSLIDIYTNGDGLTLTDHEFSVDWTKVAKKGDLDNEITRAKAAEKANADAITAETTRATEAEAALLGTDKDTSASDTIKGAKKAVEDLKAQIEKDAVTLTIPDDDPYITASKDATTNKYTISSKKDGTTPLVDVKIDAKLTEKINSLDGGGTSTVANGISVTVTETDGIVSKPIVAVTPGSVAADDTSVVTGGAVYTAVDDAKSALIGTKGDAATEDTIYGAKQAAAAAKAAADNASAKVDTEIGKLDVTNNTSDAIKGVTVTVNETDGKVIKPVVSIAAGTVGGASDANLVTGDTVKTYVDTAITNAALVWHDIA